MHTIADLMSAVAERLVGDRELKVIFRDPAYAGTNGCFYKSASGKPIIELKPYLDDDHSLHLLLHECAHAILHRDDIVSKDVSSKPSGSMRVRKIELDPKHESEADRLADKWLSYAKRHVHKYREPGMLEIEALLWALLDYQGGE